MAQFACYIPSFNDSELVQQTLVSVPDWHVVISDNASDEPHRRALALLASDRVEIVRHEISLGRVGNWKSCFDHFLRSGHEWMKLLVAGNLEKPGSLATYRRAFERYPDVRFIISNLENVWPHTRMKWAQIEQPILMQPAKLLREVALQGNVFHSLTASLVHCDAIRDGFDLGDGLLSYCADLRFCMQIARRMPTLYLPDVTSEFVFSHRKTYRSGTSTVEHLFEEGLLRLRAIDAYLELTGDRDERDQLVVSLTEWLRNCVHPPGDGAVPPPRAGQTPA